MIRITAGPINLIKISNDQQTIAYSNTQGDIALYSLKSQISKSTTLGEGFCTSLYWRYTDKELYCGSSTGSVGLITLSFFNEFAAAFLNIRLNSILILDSRIAQIDGFNDYLLVSSQTNTILCNNEREEFKQIGNRPRDGNFGACFAIDFESLESQQKKLTTIGKFEYEKLLMDNVMIYCSRPGMRLWQVDLNGNIKRTHQYKNANFINEKVNLLSDQSSSSPVLMDKTNQFQIINSINNVLVLTWNSFGLYIIDPTHSKILFWSQEFNGLVASVKVLSSSVFLFLKDGRLIELTLFKLEQYAVHLSLSEDYMKTARVLSDNIEYFVHLLHCRLWNPEMFRVFLKLRDVLIANDRIDMLKTLSNIFDELPDKNVQNVVILNKNMFHKNKDHEKKDTDVEKIQPTGSDDENTSNTDHLFNRAIRQLYILHQTSLISNLNFRERLCKIFDEFQNSSIIKILDELESLFVENSDYTREDSKKVVSKMFLDYLQPEIIFEIEDEKTLSYIANALIEVQSKRNTEVSRCFQCEFPLNSGSSGAEGYEEIGIILQQFFWSRREYDKCFQMCQSLPYLLKITGKFITDEKNFDKMIPYAINLGDLEILHKALEHFSDIQLFHQLLDDYVLACSGKFKCLKCDEINELSEVHRILTWDCLFQAIEFYLYGDELIELILRFSKYIPNGALSRHFYMKLLLHATD